MLEIKPLPNGHREVVATEGVVCRRGCQPSPDIHRMGMLPSDTIDDFEEVLEVPAFTKAQYDEKVAQLVRQKYSESEEFAIQRKYINTLGGVGSVEVAAHIGEVAGVEGVTHLDGVSAAIAEYVEYNDYVEKCKEDAKNPELYKAPDGMSY